MYQYYEALYAMTSSQKWLIGAGIFTFAALGFGTFRHRLLRARPSVEHKSLEEPQFRKLMNALPGALFQFSIHRDGSTRILFVSPGFERVTGLGIAELVEDYECYASRIPIVERVAYRRAIIKDGVPQAWDFEHRFTTPAGEEKWLRVSATPEENDEETIWHGYLADITQRKRHEIEAEELAYFDPLTRLPNRRCFYERLHALIAEASDRSRFGALLFINLDNFKALNDTRGHDTGDEYLKLVAGRLVESAGEDAVCARIGGDEFVVISRPTEENAEHASRAAISLSNRILEKLREPFSRDEVSHHGSASIGIVIFGADEGRAEDLLKRADIAMYRVKTGGRDGAALFDPAAMDHETARYQLLGDLRATLVRGGDEFELHFQPQLDAEGQVVGAEALIRWNHPLHGRIMPDRFIPLTEQFGLICQLTGCVVEMGLAQLARWQEDPLTSHLRLSLNISVQSLTGNEFAPFLAAALRRHGVDGGHVTLEVTEHVMAGDKDDLAKRMRELKKLGVRLALDDFGTGYSSLAYLKSLPFDELKIDGGFVRDIDGAGSDRALIRTILAMARTLGLAAVAEQVETARQAGFLRTHGCTLYQGYLYSPALPAEQFNAWLVNREAELAKQLGERRVLA